MEEELDTAEKQVPGGTAVSCGSDSGKTHPISLQFEQCSYHIASQKLSRDKICVDVPQLQSRLLLFLCQHQGEIISRQQLVSVIWQGKIVAENSITVAMAELRKILGDKAKTPHYIQTLKNQGYRFLPRVSYAYDEKAFNENSFDENSFDKNNPDKKETLLSKTSHKVLVAVLTAVIVALVISNLLLLDFAFKQTTETPDIQPGASVSTPITSLKGQELYGSYDPNANIIVFSHQLIEDERYSLSLKAKSLTEEHYAILTDTASTKSADYHPAISPKGDRIVFNRTNLTTQCDFMLADFDAVNLRLSNLSSVMQCPKGRGGLQVSWKDEESLLLSYAHDLDAPLAIYRLDIKTGQRFVLTEVENIKGHGDYRFAYSKSSNKIAYLRNVAGVNGTELWVLDLSTNVHKKLTTVNSIPYSVAWVNSGKHLVVRTAYSELSLIDMNGIVTVIKSKIKSAIHNPFAIHDTKIAFMVGEFIISDVYLADLKSYTINNSLSSSFSDSRPTIAKLNKTTAFVSKRAGLQQIWLSNKAGLFQLTHFQSPVLIQSLALSPKGQFLAYDAEWGVVLLDGTGKQLFVNREASSNPTFSLDGQYLYFQTKKEKISRLELSSLQLEPFLSRAIAPKAGENGSLYFIRDRQLYSASASGGVIELMALPEFSQIWKPEHYDVIDGQFYYAKKTNDAYQLVKRPLSGGEDVVVTELSDRSFSLNIDASLMVSSRPINGETNFESIELSFP